MPSQERLALNGAINLHERKINTLRLKVKGAAALIRTCLSPYNMLHLDELDIEQLEANYSLFINSLKELSQLETELNELRREV